MTRTLGSLVLAIAAVAGMARESAADTNIDAFEATTDHGWQKLVDFNLGMDFQVLHTIQITELGIFDDYGDGLQSSHVLRIYDLDTQLVLASAIIGPGDGTLRDYFRYVPLAAPLTLGAGRNIAIAASYEPNNLDRDANSHDGTRDPNPIVNDTPYLQNYGISRYIDDAGLFPSIPDMNWVPGPANRYHSGSFRYSPNPEPGTMLLLGLAGAGAAWRRRRTLAKNMNKS